MQSELVEVEELLSSPQDLPRHKEEKVKVATFDWWLKVESRDRGQRKHTVVFLLWVQVLGKRIQAMRTTVAEIQRCKPDLCLPDGAEETLVVFSVVDQMQTLLLDLQKV